MFAHHCTACDRRMLIFPSQILSVREHEDGLAYQLECWCGAEQTMIEPLLSEAPVERSAADRGASAGVA
jgi:hypothetical protein